MYPIDTGVDAVIDDDVEVLVVSPPRTTEEKASDADPVPVRQDESAPPAETEHPQTEAEHPPLVTEIPSSDSGHQVCRNLLIMPFTFFQQTITRTRPLTILMMIRNLTIR